MNLTKTACQRLAHAQINGLFTNDTEESIVEILLQQEIVTEANSQHSVMFDITDVNLEDYL